MKLFLTVYFFLPSCNITELNWKLYEIKLFSFPFMPFSQYINVYITTGKGERFSRF